MDSNLLGFNLRSFGRIYEKIKELFATIAKYRTFRQNRSNIAYVKACIKFHTKENGDTYVSGTIRSEDSALPLVLKRFLKEIVRYAREQYREEFYLLIDLTL